MSYLADYAYFFDEEFDSLALIIYLVKFDIYEVSKIDFWIEKRQSMTVNYFKIMARKHNFKYH